ncbi:MAG: hypothetical protein R3F39_24005 [Myxococcota bacterium]
MKLTPVIIALSALVAACASSGDSPTGTLRAPLVFPGPDHGVTDIGYVVVHASETCAGTPIATATRPIEAEPLPIHLEGDPPGGDAHPFGDALFVLPPGDYRVCATPLLADGSPSPDCAAVEGTATVIAEVTVEIVLISQCDGDPTGALDIVTALNDPPHIDGLGLDPSKFSENCAPVTMNVSASDPNGDTLGYTWTLLSAPAGQTATLTDLGAGSGVFEATGPGAYSVQVVVDDGHGATASLTFPIHVSGDCGVPPGGTCPATAPDPNGACTDEGLVCDYGQECCCGECFSSFVCECSAGGWACFFTDACFIPSCDGTSNP